MPLSKERFDANIDHFIAALRTIQMQRAIYSSSTEFVQRLNSLCDDYEILADAAMREGNPLFKSLLIGLRSGFGSAAGTADKLQEQVDQLRKFYD